MKIKAKWGFIGNARLLGVASAKVVAGQVFDDVDDEYAHTLIGKGLAQAAVDEAPAKPKPAAPRTGKPAAPKETKPAAPAQSQLVPRPATTGEAAEGNASAADDSQSDADADADADADPANTEAGGEA